MKKKNIEIFNLAKARNACLSGQNVTELLRKEFQVDRNTPEIIEIAYDLQSGSYIENFLKEPIQPTKYSMELAAILGEHVGPDDRLLDVGTGELTTLSLLVRFLTRKPSEIFAVDISWSRIYKGLSFASKQMGSNVRLLRPFVGDVGELPLCDKSMNVTTSSHALEPNGGRLNEILKELFRVTADKLVLFEPYYEGNSSEGKARMDSLGYIKGLEASVLELGGELIDRIEIKNIANRLNPTVCFVIKPPKQSYREVAGCKGIYSVPGSNLPLVEADGFLYSADVGVCYPILKGIPVLRSSCYVLATAFRE